jgi:hypothetical protein
MLPMTMDSPVNATKIERAVNFRLSKADLSF